MRPKSKIMLSIAIIALVCVIVILYLGVNSRNRALLDTAIRVADTTNWFAPDYPEFHWLNDHELLFFKGVALTDLKPYRLDMRQKIADPLHGLAKIMMLSSTVNNETVSPDGKWMLWNDGPDMVCSNIGGSIQHRYKNAWPGRWLGDNNHWMQFELDNWPQKSSGVIHDLTSSHTRHMPIVPPLSVPSSISVGPIRGTRFYYVNWSGSVEEYVSHVKIIAARLEDSVVPYRTMVVILPPFTKLYGLSISPAGDRIAWLSCTEHVAHADSFLRRLLPGLFAPKYVVDLNVCKIDGTNVASLGMIPVSPDAGKRPTNNRDPMLCQLSCQSLGDDPAVEFSMGGA